MIGIDTTKNWKDPGNSPRLGSLLALGFGEAGADIIGVLELQPGLGKLKKTPEKRPEKPKGGEFMSFFLCISGPFFL